jgi:hypothetical protein
MWRNTFRASSRPSGVVGRGLAGYNWPDHDQQRTSRYLLTVEPEAPGAVVCF